MQCTVSVVGCDRKTHTLEVEATSLFDAVDQAVQRWALLWWYRHQTFAAVRAGERIWKVNLEVMWVWRGGKERMTEKITTISAEQMAEIQAAIKDCAAGTFTVYYPSLEQIHWENARFVVHTDPKHELPLVPAMHYAQGGQAEFMVLDPRGIVIDETTNKVVYSPRFWPDDWTPKVRRWLKQHPVGGCRVAKRTGSKRGGRHNKAFGCKHPGSTHPCQRGWQGIAAL